MRQKYKSQTVKKGNGSSHDQAVENVKDFLVLNNRTVVAEWYQRFDYKFNQRNKLRDDYSHQFDLACFRIIDTFGKSSVVEELEFLVEIDGEKHSKKNQQINDGLVKKYVDEKIRVPLIRLDKRECLGDEPTRTIWLFKQFKKYLK